VANGGRVVGCYQNGKTFVCGRVEDDPGELKGVREGLRIRSQVGVPLEVGGQRRGMIMIASLAPDHFNSDDVRFTESVARWVGMVAHRAELVEAIARTATEEGRRAGAEELVTLLAHDLRNLLSPISARLSLIQVRAQRDQRASDNKDAGGALQAVERVRRMIANILDIARIERGMFELQAEAVDLTDLSHDVAHVLSTPAHPVEVAASEKMVVVADAERLRQCLENLVTNGQQHSPEGLPVFVMLRTQHRADREWVRVEVRDEGPGISPDVLPHIFDRFVSTRHSSGLGLGLFIARRIAEAHGGELSVESAPGKGTVFILSFPCLREAH
jgi:two-component system OmpR family sensor kinase